MWQDSTVVYKKPVKFETVWVSKDLSYTDRYTGRKHEVGDIWQDQNGCYHTITLNHSGEGACIEGPIVIEEFLRKQGNVI
jgi:hypothetical protein